MLCFHDRMREFVFADKQAIKMCVDCSTFEGPRHDVLCPPLPTRIFSDADMVQHWDVILNDVGLSMDCGTPDWLMFEADVAALQPHRQTTRKKHDMVDDHEWATNQRPFAHTLSMPRPMKTFCPTCSEIVVDASIRITRGVYLPIEHDCPRVRVYDLQGKLIEVI